MFLLLVWKVIFVISTTLWTFFFFTLREQRIWLFCFSHLFNFIPLFILSSCFSSCFHLLWRQLCAGDKSCALKSDDRNKEQLTPETSFADYFARGTFQLRHLGFKWAIRWIASVEAAGGAGTQHGYLHIYLGHIPSICACINMDTVNQWQEQPHLIAVEEQHLWYRFLADIAYTHWCIKTLIACCQFCQPSATQSVTFKIAACSAVTPK